MFGGNKKTQYVWYIIKPLEATAEKQNTKANEELLTLCRDVSDFVFYLRVNLHHNEDDVEILIRIPKANESILKGLKSFAQELYQDDERGLKTPMIHVTTMCPLKLEKNYAYPLVTGKDIDSLYTAISKAPAGILVFKLVNAPSIRVTKKLNQIKKKNASKASKQQQSTDMIDPYVNTAESKAKDSMFYYAEMYFGTINIAQVDEFFRSIPYTNSTQEPNRLSMGKLVTATAKDTKRAETQLRRILTTPLKNRKYILSEQDIKPFVRLPESPQDVGMDTGQPDISTGGERYNVQDFDSILNPEIESETTVTPSPEEHAEFQVSHIARDPIEESEQSKYDPPPHSELIKDKPKLLEDIIDDNTVNNKPTNNSNDNNPNNIRYIEPEIPQEVIHAFKILEEYILKRKISK